MSIRWEIYRELDEFDLLIAAFLWVEIEPTSETIESPPFIIEKKREVIQKKLHKIERNDRRSRARKIQNEGRSADDAIKQCILEDELLIRNTELFLKDKNSLPKKELIEREISRSEIIEWLFPSLNFQKALKTELIEVANNLGQKPKFLFEEDRRDIDYSKSSNEDVAGDILHTKERNSYLKLIKGLRKKLEIDLDEPIFLFPESIEMNDSNVPNLDKNSRSTKERESYLKLIKGLLEKLEIDPSERGIAKGLVGCVFDAGERLGDDKILAILKEVQGLSED